MPLIRISCVQQMFGYKSRASIYAAIKKGLLTSPVKTGERSVAWPQEEISAVCNARVAGWADSQLRELVCQLESARTSQAPTLIGG